jgi:hypothetical protein
MIAAGDTTVALESAPGLWESAIPYAGHRCKAVVGAAITLKWWRISDGPGPAKDPSAHRACHRAPGGGARPYTAETVCPFPLSQCGGEVELPG